MVPIDKPLKDWIDEVNQACRASNRGFRTAAIQEVSWSCKTSNFVL